MTLSLSLDERVAALEAALMPAVPELTAEQAAELETALHSALADGTVHARVLPRGRLLTPETVRELLRECVTVVRPGDVLVMSMPPEFTPMKIREVADSIQWWCQVQAPDLKVLVVPACDIAVAEGEPE